MGLFALTCPYELSNQAFVTSTALLLGVPVPHACFLKNHVTQYQHIDVWADFLLNDAGHAAGARHSSHNRIALELACIATRNGIPTTAVESRIPFCEDTVQDRGDMATLVGGLIPTNPAKHFTTQTRLVMDVQLCHVFSNTRTLKRTCLASHERQKRTHYQLKYRHKGYAFSPFILNSWGQCSSDLLRYFWSVASHAAQHSFGSDPLPASRDLPQSTGSSQASSHPDEGFVARRGRLYHDCRQRALVVVYEAITERVFGRTFALQASTLYRTQRNLDRPAWTPLFHSLSEGVDSEGPRSVRAASPVGSRSVFSSADGGSSQASAGPSGLASGVSQESAAVSSQSSERVQELAVSFLTNLLVPSVL